ncbi:MAG: prepilin-type N-terminal cleavage/methylation domain-containing protein [Elusimicrobiales bacterium]|nr:prepilin-type N-terminal cleavage/methylation domain-containing protein [Elusimicrobiales bacterium]
MKKSFTLIELLIVIIIISTLASISAPIYIRTIERFRVVEATKVMYEIKNAQEEVRLRKGKYTERFDDFSIEIYDKDKNICKDKTCELKYFIIQIKVIGNNYHILAQRKPEPTPPPSRYNPNYIYFYDSKTDSFGCNDANCAKDFI